MSGSSNSTRDKVQTNGALRYGLFLLAVGIGAVGTWYFWLVVSVGGVRWAEIAALSLFVLLFTRLAFSFVTAVSGFITTGCESGTPGESPPQASGQLSSHPGQDAAENDAEPPLSRTARTSVVVPVYNESPQRVAAGVRAMVRSLNAAGACRDFDFYILSDSTDPTVWLQEELVWEDLSRALGANCSIFYRHRPKNTSRKAGNIADFVSRWGSHYEYMLVLDADSLMSGPTMVEMVRRMDSHPRTGILQVPPVPIGRTSLFARLQQFSASLYGPVFARGLANWAGDEGNYWGHNAIIRVGAFLDQCALPTLPGQEPLGGEILSHDFVEAALMVRGKWDVHLAADLGGSYEECPTTLADYAQRDQRWCQGNLQHATLISSEGFHPISRLHFLSGVMAYAASPLWILFTVLCLLAAAGAAIPNSDGKLVGPALGLFLASMAMLLAPKMLAGVAALMEPGRAQQYGGSLRLLLSMVLEIVLSVLLAPIMAVFHTRFVIGTLLGRSIRWSTQQRDEHGVTWREAASQFGSMTAIGIAGTAAIALYDPALLVWFSPILIGLLLSIPLAVAMGNADIGRRLRSWGLLLIPEETSPSPLVQSHQRELSSLEATASTGPGFESVIQDPAIFELHRRLQRETDANLAMPHERRDRIVAAFRDGASHRLSPQDHREALLDEVTLEQLLSLRRSETATTEL